jgi:hypothetical protein
MSAPVITVGGETSLAEIARLLTTQRRETGFKFPQEYSEICELSGETGESHDE